jgi:hypothetical protein
MNFTFTIKRGKQGRIGSLTAEVEADSIDAAVARQLEAQYVQHCAVLGLMPEGDVYFEAQANWLTGGLDVTATAYVRVTRRRTRKSARGSVRLRKAAAV